VGVFSTDTIAIIVERRSYSSTSDTSIVMKHISFFTFTFIIIIQKFELTTGTLSLVDSGVETTARDAGIVPEKESVLTSTFSIIIKITIASDTCLFELFVSFRTDAFFISKFGIGNAKTLVIFVIESCYK